MDTRTKERWKDERTGAYLARAIAAVETASGGRFADLFSKLAEESEAQSRLIANGTEPAFVPDVRARIVAALVRRIGPRAMRPVLAAMKVRGLSVYSSTFAPSAGHTAPAAGRIEQHHRSAGGGSLRAAVFGINDGLVSNTCLILGVAGASASNETILISGVAGLLAGAFSMAAGEYISMLSQRQMFEHQIALERAEIEAYPEAEAEELALIYAARGVAPEDARRIAKQLLSNKEQALDTLAREELGLNPEDLGSPIGAAFWSFLAFSIGALLPLAPYLLFSGPSSLLIAIGLAGVALFGVGAALSLFSGRSALVGGLRMLGIGGLAAAATYGIGLLFGVGLA